MKKIIALLLVLTLSLGLMAGCAPADPTTAAPTLAEAVEFMNASCSLDDGKATPADYRLIAQVSVRGVAFEVTWTASLDTIKITKTEDGKYWNVDVPSKNDTETEYTLTATIKDAAGNSESKTYKRSLPVYDDSAAVTELVEDQPYKMYLIQANVGKTLFATTATQKDNGKDKYIKTDVDPKAGADFYAEKVEGGYKFYTMIDGVKNYVHAYLVANGEKASKHIGFATETDCVYYYKTDVKAWHVKLSNEELEYKDVEYVVGTYNTFDTICISESTYITAENTGVSQFPIAFVTKEAGEAMTPTTGPADPTELTSIADFNAIAAALEDKGAGTVEKYLVKGVIVEIKSTQYGNMYIQDEAGNKLYVYGLYSKDGETRFDAMDPQPKVGDTVTLMGIACNYNGAQMKNAWLQELIPGEGGTEGGGNEGGETTKPADGSTLTIPAFNEIAAAQPDKGDTTTEKYVVSGVIVEIASTKYGNMYIQDEAGNKLYVYGVYAADGTTRYDALEVKPQVGDYITLLGVAGNYNGAQMKNGAIQAHKALTTIPAFNEIAAAQPDKGATTTDKYLVTGEITEIKSDKYGNMYIKDAEGNTMYIYGLYSSDGKTRYDGMTTKPVVGDTITVLGVAGNYNGAQMKDAWLVLHTPVAGGETAEVFTAVTGKLNVVVEGTKQYMVALDDGWVTAATTEAEAGSVVIEFNADKTLAKIKVGGKYIAPKGGNNNGIKEGEYVWAVEKTADGAYKFLGQGNDTVTLAFNTDGNGLKFRAYKNATLKYPCEFTFTAN